MTDYDVVKATQGLPATVESIRSDLVALGVTEGMVLLVHSSLSSMGWVCGGPVAVVLALEEAIGPEGTLVMPSYSSDLSEPSHWKQPPVPEAWWPVIREAMPAYDPKLTPTRDIGAIPECFRNQDGTRRSIHPSDSFAARGRNAQSVVANHALNFPMGDESPLARIYDLAGWVLLLGATFQCASSLHLAEYRARYRGKKEMKEGAPVLVDGKRKWVEFSDFETDERDFGTVGASFSEDTGLTRFGHVANARALLFPQREFVEYAVSWMEKNRQ